GNSEEPIVKAHFGLDRMRGAYPMNRAFDLAARSRATRLTVEIGRATKLDHIARIILHDLVALDNVRVLETDFAAGFESKVLWRRHLHEIRALDKQLAAEWNL